MLIGLDDTDSTAGGCTTHLASQLVKKLKAKQYPKLIRLNPNIPYKTRGNGAVSFTVDGSTKTKKIVLDFVKTKSQLSHDQTNPGVVFVEELNQRIKTKLQRFYARVVSEYVCIDDALKVADSVGAQAHGFNNGRGVVGALAALGAHLTDMTYELIAYRDESNFGIPRKIEAKSVFEMNDKFYPQTFDNVDLETQSILITPRGHDPIFAGIRGENPEAVMLAWEMIRPGEKVDFIQIFETNQGTDAHIRPKKIADVKPYDCVRLSGLVSKTPRVISGGHVIFKLEDETGSLDCAAYAPTGDFKNIIKELKIGDSIIVYGGVAKYPDTVNLEKINVKTLTKQFQAKNIRCCNRKMTSAGKDKGVKCRLCGRRVKKRENVEISRKIKCGFYEVPPRARRHLSKPIVRK